MLVKAISRHLLRAHANSCTMGLVGLVCPNPTSPGLACCKCRAFAYPRPPSPAPNPVTGLQPLEKKTMDDLLTAPEAAAILRTTTAALASHRHRGTGPDFVRAGRRILYRRSAIEAWLRDVEAAA